MADIEKVIEGLNYCKEREGSCISCPGSMECWCDEAIELLKKQMPMKPKSKTRHGECCQIQHWCPSCTTMLYGHPRYCSRCGQAVKWSE